MEQPDRIFEALVADVEARWDEAERSRSAFAAIATEVLEEARLHTRVTVAALVDYLVTHPGLPQQVDPFGSFGAPPVTVRFEQGFALDVYFWNKPEVVVHNHAFDGAFTVLEGVSLHTLYRLEAATKLASDELPPLLVGDVTLEEVELLRKGDVRPIHAGLEMVHQVAHLASPCVSVVLRTTPNPALDSRIYDVLPPGIALLQSRYMEPGQLKKLSLVGLLYRLKGSEDAASEVARLLDAAPDLLAAWGLRTVAHVTQSVEQARGVAKRMTGRPWFEALLESIQEADTVVVNWDTLLDPGHRLFTVLVRHVPDWDMRDQIALEYAPEGHSFAHMAIVWTMQMAQGGFFGVGLPPVALVALGAFLAGHADAEAAEMIAAQYEGVRLDASHVAQMREFFHSSPLYRSLLEGVPPGGVVR